jgi:tRNA-dihydrouridine synthase
LAVPADLVDKTVSLWQKPGRPEQAALIVRQARELTDRLREGTAIPEMRKQLAAYLRGSRDAAHWKNLAMQAKSLAEVQAVLEQWAQD